MTKVVWFRKLSTASAEWQCFTDIENELIEEALVAKNSFAELDEYIIDFTNEIAKTHDGTTYTVQRRMVHSHDRTQCGYQQHFGIVEQPFSRSPDEFSHEDNSLIWKWMRRHNLEPITYDVLTPAKYVWVLNQAASGIISEGSQRDKIKEANLIANKLLEVQTGSVDDIHTRVVFLYTCASFLYQLLNEQLRAQDTSKTKTLGPFAYLLWLSWHVPTFHKHNHKQRIYRGVHLDESMIDQYRQAVGQGPCTWHGFTSASKSRDVAEIYGGNTLFIMDLDSIKPPYFEAIDISAYSNFNDEEEVLLPEHNCFRVDKIEKCNKTQKYLIYIVICDPYAYSQ